MRGRCERAVSRLGRVRSWRGFSCPLVLPLDLRAGVLAGVYLVAATRILDDVYRIRQRRNS
jgi:hypothetical protein